MRHPASEHALGSAGKTDSMALLVFFNVLIPVKPYPTLEIRTAKLKDNPSALPPITTTVSESLIHNTPSRPQVTNSFPNCKERIPTAKLDSTVPQQGQG